MYILKWVKVMVHCHCNGWYCSDTVGFVKDNVIFSAISGFCDEIPLAKDMQVTPKTNRRNSTVFIDYNFVLCNNKMYKLRG